MKRIISNQTGVTFEKSPIDKIAGMKHQMVVSESYDTNVVVNTTENVQTITKSYVVESSSKDNFKSQKVVSSKTTKSGSTKKTKKEYTLPHHGEIFEVHIAVDAAQK